MRDASSGLADTLHDAIVEAMGVPREKVIQFWLHRTRRGKSILTVQLDGTTVAGPPIQHVYELVQIPDASDMPEELTRGGRLDTMTADLPHRPRRRFTLRRNTHE